MDIEALETVVRSAGKTLLAAHLKTEDIHEKAGEANFVTSYDVTIQQQLMTGIRALCPDAVFFGEEDTDGNAHRIAAEGYTFIIDPIDGTTNFLFDYHHSCISVGVAKDGQLYAGMVYDPYVDEMFTAVKGCGAKLLRSGESRRLRITDKALSEGVASFGCARYNEHDVDVMFCLVKELFLRSLAIRNGGSAALDLCRIASGSNVLYAELLLQPYDYAAAAVLIEEAGGVITQPDGQPIALDRPCGILAGTVTAHREAMKMLADIRSEKEGADPRC